MVANGTCSTQIIFLAHNYKPQWTVSKNLIVWEQYSHGGMTTIRVAAARAGTR
jgi:hypothetical protein